MTTPAPPLTAEQRDVLDAWLPDDHEASVARLTQLRQCARWGQQRPQDKKAFERLRALETAAAAGLWVLRRLPPDRHEKSQLDASPTATHPGVAGAPRTPSQPTH